MTKAKPTAPETMGMHVRRPSDASAAAKLAKADKRAADYNKTLLPALLKERQREFEARLTRAQVPSSLVKMCNATMPGSYRTGDGETPAAQRPGSQTAYSLPSRGIGT